MNHVNTLGKLVVDSGAFSLSTGKFGTAADYPMSEYVAFTSRHADCLIKAAAPDIIGDPVATERNFHEFVKRTKLPVERCMPTYHMVPGGDLKRFDRAVDYALEAGCEYFAFGGMVGQQSYMSDLLMRECYRRLKKRGINGRDDLKVHFFGQIHPFLIRRYRPWSFDTMSYYHTGCNLEFFTFDFRQQKTKKSPIVVNGKGKNSWDWTEFAVALWQRSQKYTPFISKDMPEILDVDRFVQSFLNCSASGYYVGLINAQECRRFEMDMQGHYSYDFRAYMSPVPISQAYMGDAGDGFFRKLLRLTFKDRCLVSFDRFATLDSNGRWHIQDKLMECFDSGTEVR